MVHWHRQRFSTNICDVSVINPQQRYLMSAIPVSIQPFTSEYVDGVVALILPIQQQEFNIPVKLEDQPDLLDIPGFYQHGRGNFWIAVAAGKVVGSVALRDIGAGRVALRKMFVASDYRGAAHGVAAQLLATLMQWSRAQGVRAIFLGTTAQFLAAHRFYEKHGFTQIAREALPAEFPVMKVDSRFYTRQVSPDLPQ
jgi:N-acetylglutamate synthase-like GNAT family acetyltransferase